MKIRTGFVSNSSSSSFLIYGIWPDFEELAELLGLTLKSDEDEDYDSWEEFSSIQDALDKVVKGNSLSYGMGEGSAWVGISYGDIGDDETGRQFKDRVEAEMEKAFGKAIKCAMHEGEVSTG